MANLPDDFWMHDEASQSLIGKRIAQNLSTGAECSMSGWPRPGRSPAGCSSRLAGDAPAPALQRAVRTRQKRSQKIRRATRPAAKKPAQKQVETPQVSRALPDLLRSASSCQRCAGRSRPVRRRGVRHRHRRLGLGGGVVLYRAALAAAAEHSANDDLGPERPRRSRPGPEHDAAGRTRSALRPRPADHCRAGARPRQ